MKKETIVRQNRCDKEMNFLLFLCFFLFMATQIFVGDTQQEALVNRVNMLLYIVFVPGFIFRLGYCYGRHVRVSEEPVRKQWIKLAALRYFVYFFLLAFAFAVSSELLNTSISRKKLLLSSFADVLALLRIPAVSAVFLTMALTLVAVRIADPKLIRLIRNRRLLLVFSILLLASALLRTEADAYVLTASLFGSAVQPVVPAVPYFAFFLFGIWTEERKPAFDWRLALGSAAVTAVSLLLYRTPLRDLCRVTISVLPVYAVYVLAELLSEVTLRVRAARFLCEKADWLAGVYSLILLGLSAVGLQDVGLYRALLLALCVMALIAVGGVGFWLFTRCWSCVSLYLQKKVRHKTAAYFVLYTLGFAFILFLALFDFFLRGKSFINQGDGVLQYFPRIVYFGRYVRELAAGLLNGSFQLPMYDFTIGLGNEVFYSLEPLYFLYAFFKEEHLEFAYGLISVLRLYLSGITFSVLCFYFKKNCFSTFLGSVVYMVCCFALHGGIKHPMFAVPMILLPLLILSVEEILRRRRWYLCTIFVAISLFSNYYFLYMNTIAMGVYFLVRFFCQKDRSKRTLKNFLARGLALSGSYLWGVAMACIILVTNFGSYLGSGRGEASYFKAASLFFYRAEWLVYCFLTFLTTGNSPGEGLRLGFLPIAMLALVFLFLRKGRQEQKAFSVIVLLFAAFPVFAFVFSGFSGIVNRWCYMIALVSAFAVAECYPDMLSLKKSEKRVFAAVIAVYGLLAFFGEYKRTKYVQVAFVLLAATFVLLLAIQEKNQKLTGAVKQSLMFCLTAGIVLWQGFSMYELDGMINEYVAPGEAWEREMNTPIRAVQELADDSFYRSATSELEYKTSNTASMLGYNSNTIANSTYNGYLKDYLGEMGATSYSRIWMKGMNSRTFLDSLAAVKYYASFGTPGVCLPYGYTEVLKTELEGRETIVSENKYALPLGYTYDGVISSGELEQYPVVERQEVMMQRLVLQEDALHETGGEQPVVTSQKIELLDVEEDGVHLEQNALVAGSGETIEAELKGKEKNRYKITLYFESLPDSETYVVLHNAFLKGDMSETAIKLTFRTEDSKFSYKFEADDYIYGTGQDDYVFNLGYHKEPITSCTITMNRSGRIELEDFGVYCQPMENMEQYTETLTEDVLENVQFAPNEVSGIISLEEEKYLALSIPYQNGWKAFVDGEEAQLYRANYTYMALRLEPGEHTICLTYEIPGVKYALVIMPGSAVLFIIVCTASWLIKRRKKKVQP